MSASFNDDSPTGNFQPLAHVYIARKQAIHAEASSRSELIHVLVKLPF